MGNFSPTGRLIGRNNEDTQLTRAGIAPLRQESVMRRGSIEDADDPLDSIVFGEMPVINGSMGGIYSEINIPGLSDPIMQYRSGKKEVVNLKFFSDDRHYRNCPTNEDGVVAFTNPEYDLQWFRSKAAPVRRNNQVQAIPPVLILSRGADVKFIRIETVSYKDIKLYPGGRPRRREITVSAFYVIDSHRNPSDYLAGL